MAHSAQNRPNESCPKYGAEYEVLAVLATDDKRKYRCRCGYVLRSCCGMVEFKYRLLQKKAIGAPIQDNAPGDTSLLAPRDYHVGP